ncbi:unnamed protein product [Coffea canephora]|uniref:Protein SCAR n=1 Tax=Coffea canephora TaxID=49390 RepID=A0A068TN65_COFCA|nr:unnamed protein product [Coffea canephora]
MPLVRVEVRSEYGLGAPELYAETNKEDPKAVLEGVAVAGLVGILRQLGDLAEFAGEVFHGLQEQVMITSSRSHKLVVRVQRIEAALPRLEKLVLAQRSHVHFAYTSGANWHSRLRCEQSHFVCSDLPRFIMDSYEHCRGPPHLDLLDKFDPGGPGSCLKRYSDPSFFKRASSGSDGAYIDKVLKEKKGRKIKKKRSVLKTGELSRGASFSNTSSRTQFASQNTDGQTSPFQTVSNYGAAKSDQSSMSLGSRYWSGDLEGLSRSSYSMHDEEQAYNESSSFPTGMPHSDSNNFVLVDGKAAVVDDSRSSLSGEQTGPSSFSVTWDGKTEILEPAGTEYYHDETTWSMHSDVETQDRESSHLRAAKEYDHDANLEAHSMDVGIEERRAIQFKAAKEYDFADTSETHLGEFDPKTVDREISDLRGAKGYDHDETLETHSVAFDLEGEDRDDIHLISAGQIDNKEFSIPVSGNIQLDGSKIEAVGQMNAKLGNEDVPIQTFSDIQRDDIDSETDNYVDALNTIESEYETDADGPNKQEVEQYSDSDNQAVDHGLDMFTTGHSVSQSSNAESVGTTSCLPTTFWTNGGLLGLQPSKPPDFSMPTPSSEVEKSKDDRIGASILNDPCNQSYIDTSQHNGNSETYGTVVPVSPHTASTRGSLEKSSNSSRMFELGNKLLTNGFHRKPSFEKVDNSTSSPSAVVSELKNGSQNVNVRLISGRSKDMLSSISPLVSPPSSPPLGHMKISFQPINGLEDHKLQLKFPDGNVSNGSGRDMFPSFQLVPEPSIPLHDAGSDSEDDTFCRSSPYGSDCPSRRSDSNSEQWESSESPSSKEPELYDALCRISFTDSVPISGNTGSAVQGEVNNNFRPQIPLARSSGEHSQSGHLFDLPILDTLHPSFMEGNDCDVNSLTELQCYKEPNPSPPPLPPPQWRAMKPQAEIADNRQVVLSENLGFAFDHKFGSTISQHPKPAPLKQEQIIEAAHTMKSKQPDLQKTTRQKAVNQAVLRKEIEENDFLHQIRTKSFNLRRTVTAKPTGTAVPPTGIQVTALLRKANEIRQAVGSDGEDDNWSDT